MKVALIHADGALPNLALMRLARYFRARGDEVTLHRGPRAIWDQPDVVYGSSIFAFSEARRRSLEQSWGRIIWGGTGVRLASSLSEIDPAVDWDAIEPDYNDYPEYAHSLGFSQRGCRLSCKFCVVPEKEGKPRDVATIAGLWRGPGHPRNIALLDNDFFGQPREAWKAKLDEIRAGRFRVCFSQGINIRLIDYEAAEAIASVQYRDNDFQRRRLYTAWDNFRDEEIFTAGVRMLAVGGVPPTRLMVYMLIGYTAGESWDSRLERFEKIDGLGALPYPMVFDRARGDMRAFARFATTGLYRAAKLGRTIRERWAAYQSPLLNGVDRFSKTADVQPNGLKPGGLPVLNDRTDSWAGGAAV